ncbi:MAG: hypothetical protein AAFN40_03345 [Cyanobacteria bacterium J06560_6]
MTFSPPAIQPLSRLQVSQGLLITTERWQHAQAYHRQRQNLHYQSLHQPGVVRGFGVCIIPPPAGKNPQHLWVKISPGIAIDIQGNPIILNQPLEFGFDPFKRDFNQAGTQTLYLVAQFVDPDDKADIAFSDNAQLENPADLERDRVRESCRFVQRSVSELQPEDVELCRVKLQPEHLQLQHSQSVHFPKDNTLDFRHRLTARPRSEGRVQVGQIYADNDAAANGRQAFQPLLHATTGLSTIVQGESHICELSLDQLNDQLNGPLIGPVDRSLNELNPVKQASDSIFTALVGTQLTHLQRPDIRALSVAGKARLQHYLQQGGVLLIKADAEIQPLETIHQKLVETAAELKGQKELRSQLEDRIERVSNRIDHNINTLCEEIKSFAQQLNYPLTGEGQISPNHPLRTSPFSFGSWPSAGNQSLRLFCWDGIVLFLGDLSSLWAVDSSTEQSHSDIRAAQEWGINLLHYAWKHHQLTQLQRGATNHA